MANAREAPEKHPERPEFELSGGALCLDFANTLGDRPRGREEKLGDWDDLLRFSRQAGSLPAAELDEIARRVAGEPDAARRALRRARALRETIYRVFSRLAAGDEPAAADLEALNAALPDAFSRLELQPRAGGFGWTWSGPSSALDRPLWPVIRSAAELLTADDDVGRVRECDASDCSWLFIDRSRNRCRRWCDMSTCGNRAKARRHYRRRRRQLAGDGGRAGRR